MTKYFKYFDKLYKKKAEDFYDLVAKNLKNKKKMLIVTANPETFSHGKNSEDFDELLVDKVTTIIPDGIAIVKTARMLDYSVSERITGVDLAAKLLEIANENKYSLALLGATEEVINALKQIIKDKYPKINLVKVENGYTKDKDSFFEDLKLNEVDICMVALGIPAQERLIYKHIAKFSKGIFVGVGGSFDVLSGTKKRAPKIFIKLNLEWFYRIMCEPSRLKRFWDNNVKFMFEIKKIKKNKKD